MTLILCSCAARKVDVHKDSVSTKLDSSSVTKKEVVTTQDNNINVVTNSDEIEITPIDTTKPIIVDGKHYKNVKIRHKKTKVVLQDNTKKKVSENVSIKATVKKEGKRVVFQKKVDRKSNTFLWWILILALVSAGYYIYKKNKTLF